jgi:hypothetical protein
MSGAMPPLPQYASMAWCPVKAQGQLYLYVYFFIRLHVFPSGYPLKFSVNFSIAMRAICSANLSLGFITLITFAEECKLCPSIAVFRVVTPRSVVVGRQTFGRSGCLHLQGEEFTYHITTRRHNPQDHDMNLRRCKNLRSRLWCSSWHNCIVTSSKLGQNI